MASLRALEVLLNGSGSGTTRGIGDHTVSDEELQRRCRYCTANAAGPEWSLEMIEAVVVDFVSVLFQSDEDQRAGGLRPKTRGPVARRC